MKKSTKILSFILIVLLIILGKYTLGKKTKTKVTLIKDVEYQMKANSSSTGTTRYYDFSSLNELSAQYAYSSLRYTRDTRFKLLNKRQGSNYGFEATVDETKWNPSSVVIVFGDKIRTDDNGNTTTTRLKTKDDTVVKLLITNCATNNENEMLDVVITLSKYKSFSKNKQNEVNFQVYKSINTETNQRSPISITKYTHKGVEKTDCTAKGIGRSLNSPISFGLNTQEAGGEILYSMTYYKHPDDNNYPQASSNSVFLIDESRMEKAGITQVNGFYYDIDVSRNMTYAYNSSTDNKPTIFNGENESGKNRKCKFEGINPYLYSGESAQIYYNKNETEAVYRRSNLSNDTARKKVKLAEDNGGIRIDKNQSENVNAINGYEFDNQFNVNSAWYGQSAFMTNTINDSTMRFMYGGCHCGITYAFMAPVPYKYSNPTKRVANTKNVVRNSNNIITSASIENYKTSVSANEGDTVAFSIEQFIPDNATVTDLKFDDKYNTTGSVYMKKTKIITMQFCDDVGLQNEFKVDKENIKVYEGNNDVTNQFNIEIKDSVKTTDKTYTGLNRVEVTGKD